MSSGVSRCFAHSKRSQLIPPEQSWRGSGRTNWNLKKTWTEWSQSMCESLSFTSESHVNTTTQQVTTGRAKVFSEVLLLCVRLHTSSASHDLKGDVWFAECCFVHVPQSFWIHSCLFDWICAPTLALKLSLNFGNIHAWFTTCSNFTCNCCFYVILLCI